MATNTPVTHFVIHFFGCNVPTCEICQVLKDGIYFTTGPLRRATSALLEKGAEYEDEQRSVVTEAVTVARSYLPVLEACSGKIGELDAFASMAFAAHSPSQRRNSLSLRRAFSGLRRM